MGSLRYAQGGRWSQPADTQAVRRVAGLSRARVVVVVAACLLPALAAFVAARPDAHAAPAPAAAAPKLGVVAAASGPQGGGALGPVTSSDARGAPVSASAAAVGTGAVTVASSASSSAGPLGAGPVTVVDKVLPDEALSSALARHGCSPDDISALLRSLKGQLDLRALRAGISFSLLQKPTVGANSTLLAFELRTLTAEGVPHTLHADRKEPAITDDSGEVTFAVKIHDAPIETKVEGVTGSVRSSLYQAMLSAGEDANLVERFVDVFAWNIDFYRQTQQGDEFKVLVEKKYAGGRFLGYGKVLAAEYVNAGAVYRGFLFSSKDGKQSGTFDDEGNGLQRTFLKAPMEITRVTSTYGMRFHPLNQHEQFHHGIDYGAPIGTPIWTVADGVVEMAKMNGGAGNMVKIKHMNGFETEYFHMSKFADGIHAGSRVKQKQIIGYVGSTGLSTGPHLHFGMFKGGDHVDPSKEKFPNAAGVTKAYAAEFKRYMEPLLEQLKALDRV